MIVARGEGAGDAARDTAATKGVRQWRDLVLNSDLSSKLSEGTCGVWLSVAVTHGLPRYWAAFTANHSITRK